MRMSPTLSKRCSTPASSGSGGGISPWVPPGHPPPSTWRARPAAAAAARLGTGRGGQAALHRPPALALGACDRLDVRAAAGVVLGPHRVRQREPLPSELLIGLRRVSHGAVAEQLRGFAQEPGVK